VQVGVDILLRGAFPLTHLSFLLLEEDEARVFRTIDWSSLKPIGGVSLEGRDHGSALDIPESDLFVLSHGDHELAVRGHIAACDTLERHVDSEGPFILFEDPKSSLLEL
jgi:hypothetical protein